MKINPWTLGLAAAGVVSLASAVQAEEATESVKTLVSSTTLSGYVSTSVHWNPGSAVGSGGTYSYGAGAAKNDGFNLDVVDLTISKPLDEGEWSSGYKAELWFGPDATTGVGNNIAGIANGSSIAIKQAYVALRAPLGNGLDFKLGIFDTIIGYESANAPDNPNYTRSWGNSVEPTSHTGLLASYRFNDIVSASAGIANTTDPVINGRVAGTAPGSNESRKTYMAALTLTAPDSLGFLKGGTLTAGVVEGRGSAAVAPVAAFANDRDVRNIYVGATVPTPVEGVTVGAAWDHVDRSPTSDTVLPVFFTNFQYDTDVVAGYVSWKATEKVKLNGRVDYADWGATASPGGGVNPAGFESLACTLTLDYALWENVISRLEYRWDHDLSGGGNFPANKGAAGRGSNNANLIALNVIYKF